MTDVVTYGSLYKLATMVRETNVAIIKHLLVTCSGPLTIGLCGTMFAQKTTALIQLYQECANPHSALICHERDTRYTQDSLCVTASGVAVPCIKIRTCDDVIAVAKKMGLDTIFWDECHFCASEIAEISNCLHMLWSMGCSVVFTFVKSPFGTASKFPPQLISQYANTYSHIFEFFSVCDVCNSRIATQSRRFAPPPQDLTDPLAWIGGKDKYTSVCDHC